MLWKLENQTWYFLIKNNNNKNLIQLPDRTVFDLDGIPLAHGLVFCCPLLCSPEIRDKLGLQTLCVSRFMRLSEQHVIDVLNLCATLWKYAVFLTVMGAIFQEEYNFCSNHTVEQNSPFSAAVFLNQKGWN